MRYEKHEDCTRRFALEKFLSPQQLNCGENTTKKLRAADECDSQATEDCLHYLQSTIDIEIVHVSLRRNFKSVR